MKDHAAEIARALGPDYEETNAAFQKATGRSRETLENITAPWKPSLWRRLNRLFAGPLGWLVATALFAWIVVRG